MKQFIVLMAMIALGLYLYAIIAGPDDSIMASLRGLWHSSAATSPYR